ERPDAEDAERGRLGGVELSNVGDHFAEPASTRENSATSPARTTPGAMSQNGRWIHQAVVGRASSCSPTSLMALMTTSNAVMCQTNTVIAMPLAATTVLQTVRRSSQVAIIGRSNMATAAWNTARIAMHAVV